jgi:hypothetical protein
MRSVTPYALVFAMLFSFTSCEKEEDPRSTYEPEPYEVGCGNQAVLQDVSKKWRDIEIADQVLKTGPNQYTWKTEVPEACVNGNITSHFYMEYKYGKDSFFTVSFTRTVTSEKGLTITEFTPKKSTVAGWDIGYFQFGTNPENVCVGCDPKKYMKVELRVDIVIDPSIAYPYDFMDKNIWAVDLSTSYMHPYDF